MSCDGSVKSEERRSAKREQKYEEEKGSQRPILSILTLLYVFTTMLSMMFE